LWLPTFYVFCCFSETHLTPPPPPPGLHLPNSNFRIRIRIDFGRLDPGRQK
jgi:hypothetical protein